VAYTYYFSKRVGAIPLREVRKEKVLNFIREHIIYRYGVPGYIIIDNGKPFFNRLRLASVRSLSLPSTSLICTMPLQMAWQKRLMKHFVT